MGLEWRIYTIFIYYRSFRKREVIFEMEEPFVVYTNHQRQTSYSELFTGVAILAPPIVHLNIPNGRMVPYSDYKEGGKK
jgi:hypothetical protein